VPGVGPADHGCVEHETAGEEEARDAAFVLRVVEPEALEVQ
jgi:hypothetical protein